MPQTSLRSSGCVAEGDGLVFDAGGDLLTATGDNTSLRDGGEADGVA